MNLKPFDFSKNVNKIDLYQHLCYYHNEAFNNMTILKDNKRIAFLNFKELYRLLKDEYEEYHKSRNYKNIHSDSIYIQYVKNITNAHVKPTSVNSYAMLHSNLYDIQDYVRYNFNEIFCLDNEYKFESNDIDDYIGKVCCIELKNYNVYVGQVNIVLSDYIEDEIESISVLFLGQWKQIYLSDVDKIKIIED